MMKRLENAFPPVPDNVHTRVEKTLKEIEKMKMPIQAKPRTGLLIAALLIILLAGIAYASSQLGLVDSLMQSQAKWKNSPSEALLQSVIPLNVSETLGDVRITLTDVAYDGDGLAIGYTCENLAPGTLAMVIYESAEANGIPMEAESGATAGRRTHSGGRISYRGWSRGSRHQQTPLSSIRSVSFLRIPVPGNGRFR